MWASPRREEVRREPYVRETLIALGNCGGYRYLSGLLSQLISALAIKRGTARERSSTVCLRSCFLEEETPDAYLRAVLLRPPARHGPGATLTSIITFVFP